MFTARGLPLIFITLIMLGLAGCAFTLWGGGDGDFFMPHGHCYLWNPRLLWLHVISDILIGTAYVVISSALAFMVFQSRRELPFHWMVLCFGLFIVACGTTHFIEAYTVWYPTYWFAGNVKMVTAIASVTTAVLLPPLLPRVRVILGSSQQERERQIQLEAEVVQRRRIEAELLEANAKLEAVNKEMEGFTYSVSHDLRAPLRHMKGFAELLHKNSAHLLDEKSQRHLSVVLESADRMGVLMDHLLGFMRLGRAGLHKVPVKLGELVQKVLTQLGPELQGRVIEWKIGPLPTVLADEELLHQVLSNLISNSIKFTRKQEQACIEIGTEEREEDVVVFIRDNGAGFEAQFADKLFGVFQRLHTAAEFEGTGIGLANVRRIVTMHGGETWATGAPQQGATFSFTLPRKDSPL